MSCVSDPPVFCFRPACLVFLTSLSFVSVLLFAVRPAVGWVCGSYLLRSYRGLCEWREARENAQFGARCERLLSRRSMRESEPGVKGLPGLGGAAAQDVGGPDVAVDQALNMEQLQRLEHLRPTKFDETIKSIGNP